MENIEPNITPPAPSAELVSRITNPCILSILMLLAILVTETEDLPVLAGGSLTVVLLLIALPLGYIYFRTLSHKSTENPLSAPTLYLKRHPKDILVLGIIDGIPCWIILYFLNAPPVALYTLGALLIVSLIIAFINLFYRASFHLAAIAVLIVMSIQIWGPIFWILALVIPVIGWAKYQLHEHNPLQMVIGIASSLVITVSILFIFK